MLIIADARLPERVLKNLERYGEVLPFASQGIVYDSISGHPDIFLCQTPNALWRHQTPLQKPLTR
jgi:hypothetical protein